MLNFVTERDDAALVERERQKKGNGRIVAPRKKPEELPADEAPEATVPSGSSMPGNVPSESVIPGVVWASNPGVVWAPNDACRRPMFSAFGTRFFLPETISLACLLVGVVNMILLIRMK